MSLLQVKDLSIRYAGSAKPAVNSLSFSIEAGQSLGIVGESGSGKTQTAMAMMGLLPANAITSGSIRFDGQEFLGTEAAILNRYRACRIAMVFQDPMTALNPYVRIGDQMRRILLEHKICTAAEARERTLAMLKRIGLPDAERQYGVYPHQLSGGMRQRAMIGAALLGEPDLLVADEPTTALDVTVQAQILSLLRELRAQSNTALLLITHDLGVVAGNCDQLLVMDNGQLLEDGSTRDIFSAPSNESTARLIAASPRLDITARISALPDCEEPIVDINNVSVSFRERGWNDRQRLHAVRPLSLKLAPGETVAIVGESGSGKTSLARAVLGLIPTRSGTVSFAGSELAGRVKSRPNAIRRHLQMVFQDPAASLNPAMRVAEIVAEPISIHAPKTKKVDRIKQVNEMLRHVGLGTELRDRFPHELSGGQAQRVAIARSLVIRPKVLICDEAVAALDGTIQNDILHLLQAEQADSGLSMIFITHDLSVVRQISHRVLVLYMGRVCEIATNDELFDQPQHPYTKAMISSVPVPDPSAVPHDVPVAGEVSSILNPPAGCPFHPRCQHAVALCSAEVPELESINGANVACHRARELDLSY
jgi:oligopeptide/dipeptide ABC transporter ATP-binding protein